MAAVIQDPRHLRKKKAIDLQTLGKTSIEAIELLLKTLFNGEA
jgi:hypothetical protein